MEMHLKLSWNVSPMQNRTAVEYDCMNCPSNELDISEGSFASLYQGNYR